MSITPRIPPLPFLGRWVSGALVVAAMLSGSLAFGAHVDDRGGKIGFAASQSEVPVDGAFRKFTADIDFSPARPEAGKVTLAIDLASVATGSSEADDLLKERDFFDVKHFPSATFTSRSIAMVRGSQFQARGEFSLKGHRAELVIPFSVRQEAGGLRIEGQFPISRRAYAVGEGQWADTGTIADEVMIRFSLLVPN